jgi:hypothetical protein
VQLYEGEKSVARTLFLIARGELKMQKDEEQVKSGGRKNNLVE